MEVCLLHRCYHKRCDVQRQEYHPGHSTLIVWIPDCWYDHSCWGRELAYALEWVSGYRIRCYSRYCGIPWDEEVAVRTRQTVYDFVRNRERSIWEERRSRRAPEWPSGAVDTSGRWRRFRCPICHRAYESMERREKPWQEDDWGQRGYGRHYRLQYHYWPWDEGLPSTIYESGPLCPGPPTLIDYLYKLRLHEEKEMEKWTRNKMWLSRLRKALRDKTNPQEALRLLKKEYAQAKTSRR